MSSSCSSLFRTRTFSYHRSHPPPACCAVAGGINVRAPRGERCCIDQDGASRVVRRPASFLIRIFRRRSAAPCRSHSLLLAGGPRAHCRARLPRFLRGWAPLKTHYCVLDLLSLVHHHSPSSWGDTAPESIRLSAHRPRVDHTLALFLLLCLIRPFCHGHRVPGPPQQCL